MQNPELKEYKTPSCTFYIPVNAAGEGFEFFTEVEQYEEEERERFARWFEQAQEQDLRNQQNKL